MDVVVLLMKVGCNLVFCYGVVVGWGGFCLSFFGGDFEFDYVFIVKVFDGWRVNLVNFVGSLLFGKLVGDLDYEGGVFLERDSDEYKFFFVWIVFGVER